MSKYKTRISFRDVRLGQEFKLFGRVYKKVTMKKSISDKGSEVSFNQWQKVFI